MFINKEELRARLQTSCDTAFNNAMRSLAPWPYRVIGDFYGICATLVDGFADGVAESNDPSAVAELKKTSQAFRKARNCFWRRDWRAARRALKEVSNTKPTWSAPTTIG